MLTKALDNITLRYHLSNMGITILEGRAEIAPKAKLIEEASVENNQSCKRE